MKTKPRLLWMCIAVVLVYSVWCTIDVLLHFLCPYLPDRVLFERAKEAAQRVGVARLQQTADSILRGSEEAIGEFFANDPVLLSFSDELNGISGVWFVLNDKQKSGRFLEMKFGTHDNYSWVVIYPSWNDVSTIKDVRWIGSHFGVRDQHMESEVMSR